MPAKKLINEKHRQNTRDKKYCSTHTTPVITKKASAQII